MHPEICEGNDGVVYELEKGELVLYPHYFSGDKERGYPGRMILAEVNMMLGERYFKALSLRILLPTKSGMLPPYVDNDYEGSQYSFRTAGSGYEIFMRSNNLNNGEFHIGLENVLMALEAMPGYEAHAASLWAVQRKPWIHKMFGFVILTGKET